MAPFFITGATGNQGGATARALLSSGHQVHALVRDPSSAAAKAIEAAGATLFQGTYSDVQALKNAAAGCTGMFLNVVPSASPTGQFDDAKNIIDASLAVGVKHLIYTSVLKAGEHNSFPGLEPGSPMEAYWITKNAIEDAVRAAGFETWTILRPGYFMTNLDGGPMSSFMFPGLSERTFKSAYKLSTKLGLVDPGDVGKVAAKVFENPGKWNGQAIDIVQEELTVETVVRILGDEKGTELKVEHVGDSENPAGFHGMIYQSQRMANTLYEAGLFEPDLAALKEVGVELRDLEQFLRGTE